MLIFRVFRVRQSRGSECDVWKPPPAEAAQRPLPKELSSTPRNRQDRAIGLDDAASRLITKIGKALPYLGGTGKIPGGILHLSITATMDPAPIDRGNLMDGDWANYSRHDSQN